MRQRGDYGRIWGGIGARPGGPLRHAIPSGACRSLKGQPQRGYREDNKSHHELILDEFRPPQADIGAEREDPLGVTKLLCPAAPKQLCGYRSEGAIPR